MPTPASSTANGLFACNVLLTIVLSGCQPSPNTLVCDGVHFGNLGDSQGVAHAARMRLGETDHNSVGKGTLFVRLGDAGPIHFADLKPEDVLALYAAELTKEEVIGGTKCLEVSWHGATFFRFEDGRLIHALVKETTSEFRFCDQQGQNEFLLPARFSKIATILGRDNCRLK